MTSSFDATQAQARRHFIKTLVGSASALLVGNALNAAPLRASFTVQQVIAIIEKSAPGAPFASTVDTIKAGSASQKVTGIVTTMFATNAIIRAAAKRGANFIIAHEPTFYNHADEMDWLATSPVYLQKAALLKETGMAVWRCHDTIHAMKPDGVMMGVLQALNWQAYYDAAKPYIISIPQTTLGNVVAHAKQKLGIDHVRVVGHAAHSCKKIALIPGAGGGRMQIEAIAAEKPDLLMVGEINEWETSEYVRDLQSNTNSGTALLVLGHIPSEEPGMAWLAHWLAPKLGGLPVTHIPGTEAMKWM